MHSLEPELRQYHRDGLLDDASAAQAIALDNRSLFPVFEELRIALYAAVVAITTGLGILLKNNLDRIGPLAVIMALAGAAAGCYAGGARLQHHARPPSVGAGYLLLLAALIISADLGYAESRFHWLGADWSRHLLLLAVVHAITAYYFEAPLLLSLSVATLAGWLGVEQGLGLEPGWRAILCAAVVFGWREIHRRLGGSQPLQNVLEQFSANAGLCGGIIWCAGSSRPLAGLTIVAVLAGLLLRAGLVAGREIFVIYAVVYGALAACILEARMASPPQLSVSLMLVTVVAAAGLLWNLHGRMRARP